MPSPILTPSEVRIYIADKAENNHLLDGEEFDNTTIVLAMDLAISEYNMVPPMSSVTSSDFPNKGLLLSGTLYKLFAGRAALLARNTMNYSDGGLQIPIEERFQLYQALAAMYQTDFQTSAKNLKIHLNIESGWGGVSSDESRFPIW